MGRRMHSAMQISRIECVYILVRVRVLIRQAKNPHTKNQQQQSHFTPQTGKCAQANYTQYTSTT